MVAKQPSKTIEFIERDEEFVQQLSKDIGCYYSKTSGRTYSLKGFDSNVHAEMGVFAWVHKESDDYFWITTRRAWVDEARASASAGKGKVKTACFPRDAGDGDSVFLDAKTGYQESVRTLRLIKKVRQP